MSLIASDKILDRTGKTRMSSQLNFIGCNFLIMNLQHSDPYLLPVTISPFCKHATDQTLWAGSVTVCWHSPFCHILTVRSSDDVTKLSTPAPGKTLMLKVNYNMISNNQKGHWLWYNHLLRYFTWPLCCFTFYKRLPLKRLPHQNLHFLFQKSITIHQFRIRDLWWIVHTNL